MNFYMKMGKFQIRVRVKNGGLGSLTSCPGLKTAAVATVSYSWYGKPLHVSHLLLFYQRVAWFHIETFFNFPLIDGEIE
jgi:hypothetical protein